MYTAELFSKRFRLALKCIGLLLVGLLFFQYVFNGESSFTSNPIIHVFSADTAPEDGVITIFVQYGSYNRPEGWMIDKASVEKGQHVNKLIKAPGRQRMRVWYRPNHSTDWFLLTSQNWHGGGSCRDEFGISQRTNHPSYHTYFENMIPQAEVPLLIDLDCGPGSAQYSAHGQPTPTPVNIGSGEPVIPPTLTPIPTSTPVPTPTTPCIIFKEGSYNRCSR